MRRLLILALGLVPVTTLALNYTDHRSDYTDGTRFSQSEAAGISLLTDLEVVSGNPDGTFAPNRRLNRAEFTKIAMGLYDLQDDAVSQGNPRNCFPDVPAGAWFENPVCRAKQLGFVRGNAETNVPPEQWKFAPTRDVNYAEAVKILVELYDLELPVIKTSGPVEWYEPYLLAAKDNDLDLAGLRAGDALTRGQMARLAASFEANAQGELDLYRLAEQGKKASSSTSSSSSSQTSSVSSSSSSRSSSSSSSSRSSVNAAFELPARSRFLILGERSQPIASATFRPTLEPVTVRGAEVKLKAAIDSIDALYLMDENGNELGRLSLDVYDTQDLTYKATFNSTASGAAVIPQDQPRVFAVTAQIKPRNGGGSTEELVQVDTFRLNVTGGYTQNTYTSGAQTFAFPKHQTSNGRITAVRNDISETAAVPVGPGQMLAAFAFNASTVSGTDVQLQNIEFTVTKSSSVTVNNWSLGTKDSNQRLPCSVNGITVSCTSIPAEMGTVTTGSTRVLQLFGDVQMDQGAVNPFLQVTLGEPGNPEAAGAIRWTDGTGNFTWVELNSPIARSTNFK